LQLICEDVGSIEVVVERFRMIWRYDVRRSVVNEKINGREISKNT
jgi:hypothetical protein